MKEHCYYKNKLDFSLQPIHTLQSFPSPHCIIQLEYIFHKLCFTITNENILIVIRL